MTLKADSIPFVHLGARSDASGGESIARVEELCWECARDEQGYLALTDLNSLARAPRFAMEAAHCGLRPLFGAQLSVLPHGEAQYRGALYRVRLLVTSDHGWRTLLRLVNQARAAEAGGRPPYLNPARVFEDPRGLLLFLGGDGGQLTSLIGGGEFERAEQLVGAALESFGSQQLFLELPSPAPGGDFTGARAVETVAAYFSLPTVVVPRISVAHAADDPLYRFLHELPPEQRRATTRLRDLLRPQDQRPYLKPRSMVLEQWSAFPEALANTLAVAQSCAQFSLSVPPRRFPVHDFGRGVDAESFIWNTAFSIATERYGDLPSRYKERLDREFRQIVEADLADAVVTLVRLHEELEAEGIQRGPGAGMLTHSLIASLLGLTRVDPLKFDLPFELAPGLSSGPFPLLELSIPENQEKEAFEALKRLFGGQATRVGTWLPWKHAAAVETIAQHMGRDLKWASSALKRNGFIQKKELMAEQPATFLPDPELPLESDTVLAWLARRLEGRARELQVEPHLYTFGGDVLETMVPQRQYPIEGKRGGALAICEWSSEELGRLRHGRLVFSHPELLDLIGHATELAREQGELSYAPEHTPITDPATFRLLREGNTAGIAPLEAPSIRRRLRQGQPGDLHQLLQLLRGPDGESTTPEPDFATLLLSHVCAAIKAHRPLAFYAAALSRVSRNARRTALLIEEIRARGIRIVDLDVNYSCWTWTVERDALRPGFLIVEAMNRAAGEEIVLKRRELHFADFLEVIQRTDRNRLKVPQLRALVKAGAFDHMGRPRSLVLSQLEEIAPRLTPRRQQFSDDLSFFGRDSQWWQQQTGGPGHTPAEDDPADLLEQEREACHIALHEHFDDSKTRFLRAARVKSARNLQPRDKGQPLTIIGVVGPVEASTRVPGLVFCDVGGCLVRATGDLGERLARGDVAGQVALFTGKLDRETFQWRLDLLGFDLVPAAIARAREVRAVSLNLCHLPGEHWKPLHQLLRRFPGPTPIRMAWMPVEPARPFRRLASARVLYAPGVIEGLNRLVGRGNWHPIMEEEDAAESRSGLHALRDFGAGWLRRALPGLRIW